MQDWQEDEEADSKFQQEDKSGKDEEKKTKKQKIRKL